MSNKCMRARKAFRFSRLAIVLMWLVYRLVCRSRISTSLISMCLNNLNGYLLGFKHLTAEFLIKHIIYLLFDKNKKIVYTHKPLPSTILQRIVFCCCIN